MIFHLTNISNFRKLAKVKIISDILPFYMSELKDYYPDHEIKSLYISINYLLNMNKSDTIINGNKIIGVSDLEIYFYCF